MTTRSMKFPVLSNEGGLGLYLEQIKKLQHLVLLNVNLKHVELTKLEFT